MDFGATLQKKYKNTVRAMILLTGGLLCAFWYLSLGPRDIWAPAGITALSLAIFHYLIMPRMEALLKNMRAKKE